MRCYHLNGWFYIYYTRLNISLISSSVIVVCHLDYHYCEYSQLPSLWINLLELLSSVNLFASLITQTSRLSLEHSGWLSGIYLLYTTLVLAWSTQADLTNYTYYKELPSQPWNNLSWLNRILLRLSWPSVLFPISRECLCGNMLG